MARPLRNSAPSNTQPGPRTFFVSSRTAQGRSVLQSDRMARLFIDVLASYMNRFKLHDFVVMPNHVHLLLTVQQDLSIEKAIQLIKGNFSYRVKKELGFEREIWQRGFSEVRIYDRDNFLKHRKYIHDNPVRAGLAKTAEEYPYSSAYLSARKSAGAKAQGL